MRNLILPIALLLLATPSLFAQKTFSVQYQAESPRHPLDLPPGESRIQLCDLKPGDTYIVIANQASFGTENPFSMDLQVPEYVVPHSTEHPAEQHFVAHASCETITLYNRSGQTTPMFISLNSVSDAKRRNWVKKFAQQNADAAKLSVSPQTNPSVLVKNVLIGGDCFDVDNVTRYGDDDAQGTFANGMSSIGIEKGIVLATGDIGILPGPNVAKDANGGFFGWDNNDADLKKLTTNTLYDVTKVEFDFTPTANLVKFDFVFGSEEYCEYVDKQYNDVFGFFISGPGIAGVKNLATVPNTTAPITINNINHKSFTNYYVNNNKPFLGSECNFMPAFAPNDIELDGFTKILTVTVAVEPCQTYHIKLAIADVADANYASAVFLKANSFNAGGQVDAEVVYANNLQRAYEGCGQGVIKFKRGTGDLNLDLPVNYTLSPQSTATVGVDYQAIPTVVTIPAGQTEVIVPINVLTDNITEGTEKIIFNISNSCSCQDGRVEFLIDDKSALAISMNDKSACGLSSVTLGPTMSGGVQPITYLWNNGEKTASLNLSNFVGTNTYTVTVTDGCGTSQSASASVKAGTIPSAQMIGSGRLCNGQGNVDLTVNFTGDAPWELVWKPASGPAQTQVFNTSPAIIKANTAGVYSLVSIATQNGCTGTATGNGTIADIVFNLTPQTQNPLCFGGKTGTVGLSIAGGGIPYQFSWSNGATTQSINNLSKGTYTVTVTESNGCTNTQSAELGEPTQVQATAMAVKNINCKGPIGEGTAQAQGGTAGYKFSWSNGQNGQNPNFDKGGNYVLTVTDANNCSTTTTLSIVEDKIPPNVQAKSEGDLTCGAKEVGLDGEGSDSGSKFAYKWDGPGFSCCENTMKPKVNLPGTYTLVLTNTENGCTSSKSVKVEENKNYPTDILYSNIKPGCKDPEASIRIVGVKGGDAPFVYSLNNDPFSVQTEYKKLRAGTYLVQVQDINGCELKDTVTFKELLVPDVSLEPEYSIEFGEKVLILAELNLALASIKDITWTPRESILVQTSKDQIEVQPFVTTEYTATVTSIDGCTDKATTKVKVAQPQIWAPNVFSPMDKNGINDRFYLFATATAVQEIANVQVFNRWGEMVYQRKGIAPDDESKGWDGTHNGAALMPGVFTWWADVILINGQHIELKGDVTIAK